MPSAFVVLTTPAFERSFRKLARNNPAFIEALAELVAVLGDDPHNHSGRHQIKKLTGVKPGEGQWRIRWRDYRLRYDISGRDVVLHAFLHRKSAYGIESRTRGETRVLLRDWLRRFTKRRNAPALPSGN